MVIAATCNAQTFEPKTINWTDIVTKPNDPIIDTVKATLLCSDTPNGSMILFTYVKSGYTIQKRYSFPTVYYTSNTSANADFFSVDVSYLDADRKPLEKGIIVWQVKY